MPIISADKQFIILQLPERTGGASDAIGSGIDRISPRLSKTTDQQANIEPTKCVCVSWKVGVYVCVCVGVCICECVEMGGCECVCLVCMWVSARVRVWEWCVCVY